MNFAQNFTKRSENLWENRENVDLQKIFQFLRNLLIFPELVKKFIRSFHRFNRILRGGHSVSTAERRPRAPRGVRPLAARGRRGRRLARLLRRLSRIEKQPTLRSVVIWSTFFSVLRFFSAKNGAKELKDHKILDWCKAENVKLEERWKMTPCTQKSALIQPLTSLWKFEKPKKRSTKLPRIGQ